MDNDNNKMPYDDGYSQQFPENTFIPDNNPENTFIPNNNPDMYGQNQNNGFYQQDNINQPYIRQYADAPKKKTPAKIYIILIAVIIFFAVVILAMSAIMKAMVENQNKKNNDDLKGGVTLSERSYEYEEEDTEDEEEYTEEENKIENFYVEEEEEYIDEEPETFPEEEEEEPEVVTVVIEENEPVYNDPVIVDSGEFYGVVTTQKDPLNVREKPDTNSKILTYIPKGTGLYFWETNYSDWYWVSYGGVSGYVSSAYVTPSQGYTYESYTPLTATVATKQDVLNLRKSPSMNGAVITGIPKGSTVTIIEYGYEWCYVSWGGYTGYASTEYLSFC